MLRRHSALPRVSTTRFASCRLGLTTMSTVQCLLPQLRTSQRHLTDEELGISHKSVPISRVLSYTWPRLWPKNDPKMRARVVTAISLVFVSKLFHIAVPFYFKGIVDGLHASGAALGITTGTLSSVNAVMGGANSVGAASTLWAATATFGTSLGAFVLAYGICRACSIITTESRWAIFAKVSSTAYSESYQILFQKFHKLDFHFHTAKHTGGLMRNMDRGSRAFESLTYVAIFVVVPTIFESILVCFLLQQQVGAVFTFTALTAVVVFIVWTQAMTMYRAKLRDEYNVRETATNAALHDSMLNIECVKLYNAEQFERRRIVNCVREQQNLQVKLDSTMALLNVGQQLAFIVAAGFNFHLASSAVLAGTMTVGDLVLIDSLFVMLYTPLSMLGIWMREFSQAVINTKTAVSMLDIEPTVKDAEGAVVMSRDGPGSIELRDVSYSFQSGKQVLKNVSLTIPGGAFVGFCGPSGSGKSSILRLIFRFFDPDSGLVLVDGQDVRQVTVDSLRRRFAVVPQDVVLFNETVRYNIAYGRASEMSKSSDNEPSMAEIEEAAKQAHIHDALQRFPKGYDTIVGERGLRLSGGEKQRVSISRALLKDADIVLADEATSALDSVTEAEVVKKLRFNNAVRAKVVGGAAVRPKKRTLVCVAHRLSTIKDCDVIFVLNSDGQLAEQGTHDELLEKNGLYATLWHKQQKRKEAGEDVDDEANEEAEGAAATSTTPPPPPAAAPAA